GRQGHVPGRERRRGAHAEQTASHLREARRESRHGLPGLRPGRRAPQEARGMEDPRHTGQAARHAPKVDGSAQFGIDVKTPGMLVAVIARSPVFGGKVGTFDATKAKAVPGVRQVVQVSTGIAVVADGYWAAKKGRDALDVTWDEGANAQVSSASISQVFAQRAQQPGAQARHDGDPESALAAAATKVDAAYELPFLAHATMEPMNCTAHVRADGVDIWAPTQFQT